MANVGPRVGLRAALLAIPLLAVLPVAALAIVVMWHLWETQRAQFHASVLDTTRAMAALVDENLTGSFRRLEALAAERSLTEGDLAAFHRRALEMMVGRPDWTAVVLIRATDLQVVANTRVPYGTPLPRAVDRPNLRRTLAERVPTVSPLFVGPTSGLTVVDASFPVVRDGDVRYVVSATIDTSHLSAMLRHRLPQSGMVVGIVDQNYRFITRSRDPDTYRGRHFVPALDADVRRAPEGIGRYPIFEGGDVFTGWAPVGRTGWTLAVGQPAAPVDAALRRSLLQFTGAMALLLLASALIAAYFGRYIARGIAAAVGAAQALARGEAVAPLASEIRDLDVLGKALERSARRLADAEAERRRLLVDEQAARRAAERASRAKDEFLAMLSHELRNPLAAITNASHLLARAPTPQNLAYSRDILLRQTAQLARLVDDLLDVSRVVRGKIELQPRRVDLAALARGAASAVEAGGLAAGRRLSVEGGPAWINGDPVRLEQAVTNLLANALKFTDEGGEVRVCVHAQGGDAVLEVRDDGIGMAPETIEAMFDLFVQGNRGPERSRGGLGVGLTLARRIAALHGGRLDAHSDGLGQGATFVLRLPMDVAEADLAAEAGAAA